MRFFFGSSQDIRQVELDGTVIDELRDSLLKESRLAIFRAMLVKAEARLQHSSPTDLQAVWTHRREALSPYEVVDMLGDLASDLQAFLEVRAAPEFFEQTAEYVLKIAEDSEKPDGNLPGAGKLRRYALPLLCGFIVGDWFNTLAWHQPRRAAA
jgi:DNA (cytosine-5)-methyltransferase 1